LASAFGRFNGPLRAGTDCRLGNRSEPVNLSSCDQPNVVELF